MTKPGPARDVQVRAPAAPGMRPLAIAAIAVFALSPLIAIGFLERDVFKGWITTDEAMIAGSDREIFSSLGARRGNVAIEILEQASKETGFKPGPSAPLPVAYMNRKLAERGEKWRVSLTPEGGLLARDIS